MTVRPMGDQVLLEVLDSEVMEDPSGFIASVQDRMHKRGRVLAVGPGKADRKGVRRPPEGVAVGDTVAYEDWRVSWHSGGATWPGSGDHALVPADAILGVLEDPGARVDWPLRHGAPTQALPGSGPRLSLEEMGGTLQNYRDPSTFNPERRL